MNRLRHVTAQALVVALIAMSSCSTSGSLTDPQESGFRLILARVSAPADSDILELTAELTNTGTTDLRSGGCMRPDLALDVQTSNGWSTLNVAQASELIQCIRAFTLAPGASQQFTTFFFPQTGSVGAFPRNVPLRARVIPQSGSAAPVLPFTLR